MKLLDNRIIFYSNRRLLDDRRIKMLSIYNPLSNRKHGLLFSKVTNEKLEINKF